jgi:hypothetical protein
VQKCTIISKNQPSLKIKRKSTPKPTLFFSEWLNKVQLCAKISITAYFQQPERDASPEYL